jgi:hypothetical protein
MVSTFECINFGGISKTLNGKYGFKVFWLAVVYPFYFPFYFSFDKASAHDNPMLLNSFQYLKLLHSKTNIFFAADKGFDALDTLYNLISVGLPKNRKLETVTL